MKSKSPLVSVILPVYNAEKYLLTSIKSILAQDYTNFELIIIDDCSSDNSFRIIQSIQDRRITVVRNSQNIGGAASRNVGVNIASGKYICAMDADDISVSNRLSIQVQYLEKNQSVDLVGSGVKYFGSRNIDLFRHTNLDIIKVFLLFHSYIPHPTFMYRRVKFEEHGLKYDSNYKIADDYDLQVRASEVLPIAVIPEMLVHYRCHANQVSISNIEDQYLETNRLRIRQLGNFNLVPTTADVEIHLRLTNRIPDFQSNLVELQLWLDKLLEANLKYNYYNQVVLESALNSAIDQQLFSGTQRYLESNGSRIELRNITFVIPFEISEQMTSNLVIKVIDYLLINVSAKIILIECGESNFSSSYKSVDYYGIPKNTIENQQFSINKIVKMNSTDLVCLWKSSNVTKTLLGHEKVKLDFPVVNNNDLHSVSSHVYCFKNMFVKKTLNTLFYTLKKNDNEK
jgi:glycosyltransferase involved in cell wall biosynthesis